MTRQSFVISPIKTEQDYQKALAQVDSLWEILLRSEQPDMPEGDTLDILTTLISVYEDKHYFIEAPDPIEAIKFRMEQEGLQDKDLVPYLGQRSRVSEVLNKKRKLSLSMIRKLSAGLRIPAEALIADYDLVK